MSFWDDITGKTAADAAANAAANAQTSLKDAGNQARGYITTGYNTATGAVNTGQQGAQNALTTGYNTATGAVNTGADQGLNYLTTGYGNAQNTLDTTLNNATAAYDPLKALAAKYGGATTMALDALGVNGPSGTTAAQNAFTASPAYEFNLTAGLDAINRARAASGQLASGNTDRSAQEFGAGLASNEYNTWLNNLLGFVSPEASTTGAAASGTSAANQNIGTTSANLSAQQGANNANLATQRGKMLSDLATAYGTNTANLDTSTGTTLANLATGEGSNLANITTSLAPQIANQIVAQGQAQGAADSANSLGLFNLGMSALTGIAGIPGVGSGIGSGLSNLIGGFGSVGGAGAASSFDPALLAMA